MTAPRDPFRPSPPEFLSELFRDPLDPGYAAAAQRRAARSGAGGSRRGTRLLSWLTLVVVGAVLATAWLQVVREEPERTQVREDLEQQIHEREQETEALQAQAEELRAQVADLRDQQLEDPRAVRDLRTLEAVAGLGPVVGDGVRVRLEDGPPEVDPTTGEQVQAPEARILYRDLQQVANALWAAGAEAVAVNGQRLTATTAIRSASGAVLVDHQPVTSPYEVVAVGGSGLEERFVASKAGQLMVTLVDEYGVGYEVQSVEGVTVPAASEPRLLFATPGAGS